MFLFYLNAAQNAKTMKVLAKVAIQSALCKSITDRQHETIIKAVYKRIG